MTPAAAAARSRRPSVFARLLAAIPAEPTSAPVGYSTQLVAYVVAICALALVIALATVRAPSDVPTLTLGAVAIFVLVLVMVRSFGGVSAPWSPTAFVHLALSLAFGPVGALTAAVVASAAMHIRLRTGWFRVVLNLANFFLANVAAWSAFRTVTGLHGSHVWIVALAGLAAGGASYVVNSLVLCGAIRLASGVSVWTFLRSTVGVVPFELAYGLGSAGFSIFYTQGGPAYLAMWLAPVVSIQGFLLMLAIRTNAHAAETERHARERVELLQRIITAADTERFRIAGDLHDGPVGTIAGLAILLGAVAKNPTPDEQRHTMAEVADELRQVLDKLRSLIFELSPHDLDKPGRLRDEITGKQLAAPRSRATRRCVCYAQPMWADATGTMQRLASPTALTTSP